MQSVRRALAALKTIARTPETPVRLGVLADTLGLNHATCAHIVKTLVEEGFVEQVGVKQGYILGPLAYALGAGGPYRKDLTMAAMPAMKALAEAVHEHVVLATLCHGNWIQLAEIEGDQEIQVRRSPVMRPNPYLAATGRICLAFLPERDFEGLLRGCGLPKPEEWPEATDLPALRAEILSIRTAQLAVRLTDSLVAMAVPVTESGRVVAGLGVYVPRFRCSVRRQQRLLQALRRSARELEGRL